MTKILALRPMLDSSDGADGTPLFPSNKNTSPVVWAGYFCSAVLSTRFLRPSRQMGKRNGGGIGAEQRRSRMIPHVSSRRSVLRVYRSGGVHRSVHRRGKHVRVRVLDEPLHETHRRAVQQHALAVPREQHATVLAVRERLPVLRTHQAAQHAAHLVRGEVRSEVVDRRDVERITDAVLAGRHVDALLIEPAIRVDVVGQLRGIVDPSGHELAVALPPATTLQRERHEIAVRRAARRGFRCVGSVVIRRFVSHVGRPFVGSLVGRSLLKRPMRSNNVEASYVSLSKTATSLPHPQDRAHTRRQGERAAETCSESAVDRAVLYRGDIVRPICPLADAGNWQVGTNPGPSIFVQRVEEVQGRPLAFQHGR